MQVANTLAYYDAAIITAVKSFIVQAPGWHLSGAPGLARKHLTCLERPAGDKHSSLLQKLVNYGRKSFVTLCPGAYTIKLFTAVIVAVS